MTSYIPHLPDVKDYDSKTKSPKRLWRSTTKMTDKTKELRDEIEKYHSGDSDLMAEEMSEKVAELKGRLDAIEEVERMIEERISLWRESDDSYGVYPLEECEEIKQKLEEMKNDK